MSRQGAQYSCLTYCPMPHNGRGWPQTCVSILAGFASTSLQPVLVLPRTRAPLPEPVQLVQSLPPPLSMLPWRYVAAPGLAALERRFIRLLDEADPATTIAYFWPGVSRRLVTHAKDRGILAVREMINTFQGSAKTILDRAYGRLGLPPSHTISQRSVDEEVSELELYDYVCASNAPCEASLVEAGVSRDRIIPTSFGWSPARFAGPEGRAAQRASDDIKVLFVGSIGVRKGVPELLEAWTMAGLKGELTLVGDVEPALEPLLSRVAATGSVKVISFTSNIAEFYRSHDIFVFPTLEEGGPQVTIEAGGCGMPVVTTAMGAGRLVEHNVSGLIVPEGDAVRLAEAMVTLARSVELRQRFSSRIARDAQNFTYDRLGAARALAFMERLPGLPATALAVRA